MKFIVSSNLILKHLQTIGGVIASNNTLPILDNFLFKLEGKSLTILASDLETSMTTKMEVDGEGEGMAAIPSRLLLDILKSLPDQPVTFLIDPAKHSVELSSDYGKYALSYLDGEEFPKLPELADASSTVVSADLLASAIQKTLFATGNDDLRPVMAGVFFQLTPDGLTFVATDAHKLVRYRRMDAQASQTAEFIMPKKPLNILKSALGTAGSEVTIHYNSTNTRFEFDQISMTCRLIDGKYPNYEAVIPRENPNQLIISRTGFLSSIKRVSLFSNKTTHQIRLKLAGTELNISAEDLDFANKAHERLGCDYNGADLEIGFNSRYLVEMLTNLETDHVRMEMSAPNRAGLLRPVEGTDAGEDVLMLVMPVMLNN
jgi:DNA polymerase-3 subunit beta